MKKTIKFLIALTTVILVSSCIPTGGGGGTVTPSNSVSISITLPTFNVISTLQPSYNSEKTVVVDGDSININVTTVTNSPPNINPYYPTCEIIIKPLTNASDFQYLIGSPENNYTFTYMRNEVFNDTTIGWNNSLDGVKTIGYSFPPLLGMFGHNAVNINLFIVFRKVTNDGNKYYWLRLKENDQSSSGSLSIYNIKWQMNSITTGQ